MEEDLIEEALMAPRTPQAPHAQCAADSSTITKSNLRTKLA